MRPEERHSLQERTSGGADPAAAGWADPAANGTPSDNDSLTAVLDGLVEEGFAASYRPARGPVEGRPAVVCGACGRSTAAEDLRVEVERRLEGASEPDEMVLAVAARCPACGAGGVLVLGYGPEASAEDSDLVLALRQPAVSTGAAGASAAGGQPGETVGEGAAADERGPGLGRIGRALDRAAPLDRYADPIKAALDRRLPDTLRSVLRGRWLGHPVHPMLTDVVIGFWTSAWVLDLVGGEASEDVADAFIAAGLVAVAPTAWTGWADWSELPKEKRRSGLVHAASNATAAALYGASLVARRRGNRTLGIGLGHAGAAAATAGGFLGGHLAFGD